MTEADKKKIASIMEKHGVLVGYLFGSAVRGTMGPHSDIDTAVLFDLTLSKEKQDTEKEEIRDAISSVLQRPEVDVINLLNATDPLIKYVAIFSGELIFERERSKRFALEQKVVREYENTRELRRIARMVMGKQLKDGSFGRFMHTL